ncbi:hypothetical protein GINT2_001886 [Glugoides intestinalis]
MFKRLFDERHLEYIKKFITKHLPTIVVQEIPFDKQCTKLLILMDIDQLKLLEIHFSMDTLKDKDYEEWLASLGFVSKINVFERNAIILDITKKKLVKIIQYNHSLIAYDNIPENTDTAVTYNLLKNLYDFYSGYDAMNHSIKLGNYIPEFESVNTGKGVLCLDFYTKKTFLKQMSSEMLPSAPDIKVKFGFNNKTKNRNLQICKIDSGEKTQESIKDFIDDSASVLRKKKILYIEKSGPIDYKNNEVIETPRISDELKMLDMPEIDPALYEKFDARTFLDEVLFVNNDISIPKASNYSSFSHFKKYIKGSTKFFTRFLNKHIAYLLMSQDTYISKTDAFFLAAEFKRYLTLPQMEYFYNIYINSSEYKSLNYEKPVKRTPSSSLRKKKSRSIPANQ